MPNYLYTAKDVQGRTLQGSLEAADRDQLAVRLYEDKLFLVKAREVRQEGSRTRLKPQELADFSRQIGTMLASGVTLIRAVDIIMQRDLPTRVRNIYASIYRLLQQGVPVSEALRQQNGAFPDLFISMYYAGESSGQLDRTATRMAQHYEKEHRLRSKVQSSMTYPLLLLVLAVIVMLVVFTVVLPTFFTFFEEMTLPLPTRIVMGLSQFMTDNWFLLLLAALALGGGFVILMGNPDFRRGIDRMLLKVPRIGALMKVIYTARFSRTLSSLYASGLTLIHALQISRGTVGNRYIADQFDAVVTHVRNGMALSQGIGRIDGFDPKLASSILIGEESGRLDSMLDSVADAFDYDAEMATQRLTAIVEPVMIVAMALVIGTIMISVMMPIYQLYQNIG